MFSTNPKEPQSSTDCTSLCRVPCPLHRYTQTLHRPNPTPQILRSMCMSGQEYEHYKPIVQRKVNELRLNSFGFARCKQQLGLQESFLFTGWKLASVIVVIDSGGNCRGYCSHCRCCGCAAAPAMETWSPTLSNLKPPKPSHINPDYPKPSDSLKLEAVMMPYMVNCLASTKATQQPQGTTNPKQKPKAYISKAPQLRGRKSLDPWESQFVKFLSDRIVKVQPPVTRRSPESFSGALALGFVNGLKFPQPKKDAGFSFGTGGFETKVGLKLSSSII